MWKVPLAYVTEVLKTSTSDPRTPSSWTCSIVSQNKTIDWNLFNSSIATVLFLYIYIYRHIVRNIPSNDTKDWEFTYWREVGFKAAAALLPHRRTYLSLNEKPPPTLPSPHHMKNCDDNSDTSPPGYWHPNWQDRSPSTRKFSLICSEHSRAWIGISRDV